MRFEWPLTGRSQEMQLIDAALADPRSAGIVIFGAAGVGKTRIAREALEAVAPNGCQVRWVVGTTAGQQLPLGALASWAEAPGNETLALAIGVIDSLTSAPSGKQVVLGIDDAHLLDDLSVFVLHEIVQRNAAKLVLTVRTGDPVSASLQDLLNRCDEFTRLDLQPLSRDESAMLASAALGGALERTAVQRLWQLTHGNALFMRSIVEHEVADGRLAQDNACWKWTCDPVVQTATQFGDRSSAQRLAELEAIVEGPRVGLASRFAAAVCSGDGAELASVSEEFEQMGDLIAAVDGARRSGIPTVGDAWVGAGMLGAGRSVGKTMWRRQYARASAGCRTSAAVRAGARDRDAAR